VTCSGCLKHGVTPRSVDDARYAGMSL